MWQILRKKAEMPTADRALPGREKPAFAVPATHFVNGNRIQPPFPAGLQQAMFGLGCFWGAEREFWENFCKGVDRVNLFEKFPGEKFAGDIEAASTE